MCYWNYFILKCCFNLIYSVMAWVENQPQLIRGRKGGHSIQSRFKFSPIRGSPSPFSQCPFYSQYTNHANQNHYEPVLNILWLYFLWLFAIFLLVPRHSFRSVFIPLGIHSTRYSFRFPLIKLSLSCVNKRTIFLSPLNPWWIYYIILIYLQIFQWL